MRMPVWRAGVVSLLSVAIINLGFVGSAAGAIVDTQTLVTSDRNADLAIVRAQLDREEVRQQLQELGVDVIWLTPIYPSPQRDNGYDISDYCDINPAYGTMETFERLLQEAHARNIRVIMDIVVNHTSTEHPWFREASSSKQSPYRDYYIWKDGKNGGAPNNWRSKFGGSAWQ